MRGILTYHSIDPSGSVISTDEPTFRRHVEWLAGGTVRVRTIGEVLAAPPREHCVALTFDDGFANFAGAAWPVLRDHGLPATVFVVTDHVGRMNDWEDMPGVPVPRLSLLGWDALGRLAEEGVEVGSHTCTHLRLDRLELHRVDDELARSVEAIRECAGVTPRSVAYPYGAVTRTIALRASAHYQYGCTTDLRPLRPGEEPLLLPRLDAYYFRSGGSLARWGTARQRAALWTRRQARRLRRRLRD